MSEHGYKPGTEDTAGIGIGPDERPEPFTVDAATWEPPQAPETVVSMKTGGRVYPLARRGEVTMLGGAGNAGKSYLALGIATAAGNGGGHHAGFDVAGGPVIVGSSEGGAGQAVRRLRRIGTGKGVHVIQKPGAILYEDPAEGAIIETPAWGRLWREAGDRKAALVILDPVARFLDVENPNAPRPVRRCLEKLAEAAEAAGCAVIGVHHSTKEVRRAASEIERLHPDQVAAAALSGSREYFDTPRAGLFMYGTGPDTAEVLAIKNNAGPSGWAVKIGKRIRETAGGMTEFLGWERRERMSPEERADRNRTTPKTGNGVTGREPFALPGEL